MTLSAPERRNDRSGTVAYYDGRASKCSALTTVPTATERVQTSASGVSKPTDVAGATPMANGP